MKVAAGSCNDGAAAQTIDAPGSGG